MRKVEPLPTQDCEAGYGPARKENGSPLTKLKLSLLGKSSAGGYSHVKAYGDVLLKWITF